MYLLFSYSYVLIFLVSGHLLYITSYEPGYKRRFVYVGSCASASGDISGKINLRVDNQPGLC